MAQTPLVGNEPDRPTVPAAAGPSRGEPSMSLLVRGEGYEAHVVIDTIVNGQSAGGVRIAGDLALDEVRELAAEMSLKYALFQLPRGGAKTGIRMSADLDRGARLRALEDFGRKLTPVICEGIYSPGMDMNCGPDELRAIYRGAGIELGKITDTSWFTAMTVFHAVESVAAGLGIEGRPVTLAIEGFGSVARHLMDRLDATRYRVVSIATITGSIRGREPFEPPELGEARDRWGDELVTRLGGEAISRDDVLTADVDILLPSSRIWSITPEIATRLGARAVVPIANAPYMRGTVDTLHARGVRCLPGYLTNSGGVLASSLADLGLGLDAVESLMAGQFRRVVDGILQLADRRKVPAVDVAATLARMHMAERVISPRRSLPRRVFDRFLAPRRPARWRAASARSSFVARSGRILDEIARMERGA